ncbi:MAG: hypothetical protein NTV43_10065 [Methylococcales bacterium]|nr:hypothetical protein [Methylococcales bacterium]
MRQLGADGGLLSLGLNDSVGQMAYSAVVRQTISERHHLASALDDWRFIGQVQFQLNLRLTATIKSR